MCERSIRLRDAHLIEDSRHRIRHEGRREECEISDRLG